MSGVFEGEVFGVIDQQIGDIVITEGFICGHNPRLNYIMEKVRLYIDFLRKAQFKAKALMYDKIRSCSVYLKLTRLENLGDFTPLRFVILTCFGYPRQEIS